MARKQKRAMKGPAEEIPSHLPRGVTLMLVAQNRYHKCYRIKTTTSLGRVLAWFVESSEMDLKLVNLIYKGETVDVSRTPEFYEMEDEDSYHFEESLLHRGALKKTCQRLQRGDMVMYYLTRQGQLDGGLMGILKDVDIKVMGNSETEWHYLSWQSCSDLPQELVDKILGMAFISSAVAHTCSIVCHSFLPITRRFLFEHLVLDGWMDLGSFLDVLRSNPSIYSCVRMVTVWAWGQNTVTKPYHSVLSKVLDNIRACALKGTVALEVVDCDIEGMEFCNVPSMLTDFTQVVIKGSSYRDDSLVKLLITATRISTLSIRGPSSSCRSSSSTVDGRALPMHSIRTFVYSAKDSSLKLLNSRPFRAYLACLLVSATSVLIRYDDECRRSAIDVVEYAQSTLKDLLLISRDPSQQELPDIRLDEYPVLRRLEVNISNDRVLVATNFTNRYWSDWMRLGRAIIDRAPFPGLRLLSLRFLWREPIEEDLEWFFHKLSMTVAATSKWFNRLSGLRDYNEQFHVKHYYITSSSRDSFAAKLEGIQILVLSLDLAKTMASTKLGSVA
ncbi:hypothetical protein ARMSODRAFT_982027 [Armillaria solidipes]|uniref:Ubiquitin-like domain-containing protein n=1 Tax=Armillaria solidipes TaxID=1076256 RepID=A0A2H3BCL7_9AGAR|nr:hypothetical protein ARMSODRAFT_982027 [Armillaria solidipes]